LSQWPALADHKIRKLEEADSTSSCWRLAPHDKILSDMIQGIVDR
jgi:hypothetical protein